MISPCGLDFLTTWWAGFQSGESREGDREREREGSRERKREEGLVEIVLPLMDPKVTQYHFYNILLVKDVTKSTWFHGEGTQTPHLNGGVSVTLQESLLNGVSSGAATFGSCILLQEGWVQDTLNFAESFI